MNWKSLIDNPALLNGLVRAIFLVAVSFGVTLGQDQQDGILTLLGATIAVVGSLILTAQTVSQTTPVAAPVLPTGTDVTVVTPEGQPNILVTLP